MTPGPSVFVKPPGFAMNKLIRESMGQSVMGTWTTVLGTILVTTATSGHSAVSAISRLMHSQSSVGRSVEDAGRDSV